MAKHGAIPQRGIPFAEHGNQHRVDRSIRWYVQALGNLDGNIPRTKRHLVQIPRGCLRLSPDVIFFNFCDLSIGLSVMSRGLF